MPELPEVETIKRALNEILIGQEILAADVRADKLWRGDRSQVIGQRITEIARRAKMLIFKLSNGYSLLFHLKMTGQLLYQSDDRKLVSGGGHPDREYLKQPPHKHTHIIFSLESGKLYFNDLRKFGSVKVLDEDSLARELASLGPEIDSPEFSFAYFASEIKKRPRTAVKTALMDQTLVAGVGNIYSDEVLFCAKVLPARAVGSLTDKELKTVYDCLPRIMKTAIAHGGTSLKDYRKPDGSTGDFLKHTSVYRRTGEPCRVCQTTIERLVISGRSAHFCPRCQR